MSYKETNRRFVVGIAGGSGSGKTTLALRMLEESRKIGISGLIFHLDNYYQPLSHLSLAERQAYNFDHPRAIDFDLAYQHLKKLCAGETIEQPIYNFKTHTRRKQTLRLEPTQFVVVEGIYALYPKKFLKLYNYMMFVSTGIATAVLRRVRRDIMERGRTMDGAKHQILSTVLPMYETYGKPTQKNAHFSINWEGEDIPVKATEGLVRMVRDFFR
ncbi:MAG: uridine kinase [Elusimicrobiota bacterium]